ncbi:MAG TPA: hypothetical protein VKD72_16190, partial [Gemmataceae bacterium]|nr:hypothetical protein [Gemmataceae bacterium]
MPAIQPMSAVALSPPSALPEAGPEGDSDQKGRTDAGEECLAIAGPGADAAEEPGEAHETGEQPVVWHLGQEHRHVEELGDGERGEGADARPPQRRHCRRRHKERRELRRQRCLAVGEKGVLGVEERGERPGSGEEGEAVGVGAVSCRSGLAQGRAR